MTDHAGQVETDLIPFSRTLVYLRILMGLAFLPDNFLGIDTTITRNETGKPSSIAFSTEYQPYLNNRIQAPNPSIVLLAPLPGSSNSPVPTTSIRTSIPASPPAGGISNITIDTTVYKVVRILFTSQTLIGRATRVFLVQKPDNEYAVLKDSWIQVDRPQEATFVEGLHIPFGPTLVDHCILRDTGTFRKYAAKPRSDIELREKRRVVMYPAGVHISDFTSLWELLVVFLDIVIGMEDCNF
jgi:hypothetical protein